MSRSEKPRFSSPESNNGHHSEEQATPLRDPRALNRPDWIAVALLAAAIVIAPLCSGSFANMPQSGNYPTGNPFLFLGPGGMPLILALVALAAAVTAFREWKRPVAIGAVPGLAGACVLMGGWATLSLTRGFTPAISLNALAVLFSVLLLGGLVSRLTRDRNALFALLGAVLIGSTLVAVFGIREYIEAFKEHDFAHRTFSSFANPDFLAGYLLLTLPITLAAFVTARERMLRLLLGLSLTFQSACLLLTGSRSGIAMLLVALVAWLAFVAFAGGLRRQGRAIGIGLAVFVVGALLGLAPTRARFGTVSVTDKQTGHVRQQSVADAQSYSGAFRRWTWDGTVRMALANPLLGTGIGTFEVAYPRYAETAFTLHAHNGYLQWMAETGIPGGFFLLAALAAATAFATHTLRLQRIRTEEDVAEESSDNALFGDRSVLLAGLLAGVLAALLHNLFDSDFYLVGTAVNFAAVIGLMVGLSRDLAPLGTQRPRPLGREMLGFTLLLAVFLFWRSSASMSVRTHIAAGEEATTPETAERAAEAYRAAATADPLDGDPLLHAAELELFRNRPDEALIALQKSVRTAPTGKALYRLGQLYMNTGDTASAITVLERARQREPRNPQTLHALAKALQSANKTDQAAAVYRQITALETMPYGTVRAMPELVETAFAYAHAALGDIAADAGRWSEATTEYTRADHVMAEYWEKRKLLVNFSRTPEKRADLVRLYDAIFTRWQEALTHLNQPEQAAQITARHATFKTETTADRAEEDRAATPPTP
ncbi:MAG: Lipid core-O-antigen ligase [Chthonomonadaceae bacterium]|nr:Lipid core-O-antigen ligase [Chthonomonadaceae bacterium]